jgi:hypothetical protein
MLQTCMYVRVRPSSGLKVAPQKREGKIHSLTPVNTGHVNGGTRGRPLRTVRETPSPK